MDILAQTDTYKVSLMDSITCPAVTVVNVQPCDWIYPGADSTGVGTVETMEDEASLIQIGYIIDPSALAHPTFTITDQKGLTVLTNMSEQNVIIRSYLLVARENIPGYTVAGSNWINPLSLLGDSLAEEGAGGAPDSSNSAIFNWQTDLWRCSKFLQFFKIVKTKNRILTGGKHAAYSIRKRKRMAVRPSKLVDFTTAAQTLQTALKLYAYKRGEMFWMHQFTSEIMPNALGSGSISTAKAKLVSRTDYQYIFKVVEEEPSIYANRMNGLEVSLNPTTIVTDTDKLVPSIAGV